jgi:tetratricopeptide (TPR) repeat protein
LALSGHVPLRKLPVLSVRGELEYGYAPLSAGPVVSMLSLAVGPAVNLPMTPWLQLEGHLSVGYFHGFLSGASTSANQGGFLLHTGAGVSFFITPAISIGLGASYKNCFGLYQGMSAQLGVSYYMGRAPKRQPGGTPLLPEYVKTEGRALLVEAISFENIFPVFFKYYDDHPIGKASMKNSGSTAVTDISLSVLVKQFMDAPKECTVPRELKGGESLPFDLYALFTEKVLEVTEGTKVAVEMQMNYRVEGNWYTQTQVETMRMQFRNAMTWDDDRKASAFITARDPTIMGFAKNVSSAVKGRASKTVDANLLVGLAIHEALRLYGLSYQVDPRTPYVEFHDRKQEVDFLQFPRETLNYRAGDCDDLSILYAALLESLGVPTAFITVPGHIYIAFALTMGAEEAQNSFSKPDELILMEGGAWVPLEVTEREGGFLSAWQRGAKEWREFAPRNQAGFYPNAESWRFYEPAALPGGTGQVAIPSEEQLVRAYQQEVSRFVDREIYPQVEELQGKIKTSNAQASWVNKLGVLYARYGLNDKAKVEFERILRREEYTPALVNMGNLLFQQGELERALEYYERASRKEPENAKVLLCAARVNHELENYGSAQKLYAKVKALDPRLAERFVYLELKGEEASRAAEAGAAREAMLWVE